MKWLYLFFNIATAPGVMLHELSHAFFCLTSGVKIHRVKLFGFGRTAGFVIHDEPKKFLQGFLISFGPLLINSFAALVLFARYRPPYLSPVSLVSLWLGLAFALNAIPSGGDAAALFHLTKKRFLRNPLVLLGLPFVLILYILNLLKHFNIDALYAAFLFWMGNIYLKG